jgi:hypothetical protein
MEEETKVIGKEACLKYINEMELAACSVCGRKTWSPNEVELTCRMPQPNGSVCLGKMKRRNSLVASKENRL